MTDLSRPALDLERIRKFVVVAEELHFGRAAERLHIVQPAVSQQLRRLERELGVALLDRTTRSVRLTEAGQRFLPHARAVLEAEAQAREAIAGFQAEQAATVRLGTGDGLGDHLDRVLSEFARRAPEVGLELVDAPAEQRLRQVRSGELDAALVRGEWARTGLHFVPAWEDEVLAALPATHPLAAGEVVDFAELAGLPLRLAGRARNPTLYDLVVESCRRAGFEPVFGKEFPTARETLAAVGFGKPTWTVLYAPYASQLTVPGVVFRPLRSPAPRMRTFLAIRADARRPEIAALIGACSN